MTEPTTYEISFLKARIAECEKLIQENELRLSDSVMYNESLLDRQHRETHLRNLKNNRNMLYIQLDQAYVDHEISSSSSSSRNLTFDEIIADCADVVSTMEPKDMTFKSLSALDTTYDNAVKIVKSLQPRFHDMIGIIEDRIDKKEKIQELLGRQSVLLEETYRNFEEIFDISNASFRQDGNACRSLAHIHFDVSNAQRRIISDIKKAQIALANTTKKNDNINAFLSSRKRKRSSPHDDPIIIGDDDDDDTNAKVANKRTSTRQSKRHAKRNIETFVIEDGNGLSIDYDGSQCFVSSSPYIVTTGIEVCDEFVETNRVFPPPSQNCKPIFTFKPKPGFSAIDIESDIKKIVFFWPHCEFECYHSVDMPKDGDPLNNHGIIEDLVQIGDDQLELTLSKNRTHSVSTCDCDIVHTKKGLTIAVIFVGKNDHILGVANVASRSRSPL